MATVKDPVCGMEIDPKEAAGKTDYRGQTYCFCSRLCQQSFSKDPGRYVGGSGSGAHTRGTTR